MAAALEVRKLSLRHGRHVALDGVSLRVEEGETVAILGANGAGKSSLLKAVAAAAPFHAGDILFRGQSVAGFAAHEAVERGIALVPEERGIFPGMSVEENLTLGALPDRARRGSAARRGEVFRLFPVLPERRRQLVGTMSGGERQMVAIGRALMSNPDLLLLDEPSLGLAPVVARNLFAALARIRASGMTIALVEQNVRAGLALADRGYLLEAGRMVGEGRAEDLKTNPEVRRAFLGGTTAEIR